ncbi:MAG: methyltransferase [Sulfolobaceae archaeon]
MSEELILEVIDGIPLVLKSSSGLFSKSKLDLGTKVLLENIKIPEGKDINVIDVGCGYGPIGIFLAKKNPNLIVYMVDIEPLAIKLAKRNAEINGVKDRVIVIQSDIFEKVPKIKFKAVYSNPPLSRGKEFLQKLVIQSYEYLEKGGFIQIVVYKGEENAKELLKKFFGNYELIKRIKGYSILIAVKD